jgi:hypothetical protein
MIRRTIGIVLSAVLIGVMPAVVQGEATHSKTTDETSTTSSLLQYWQSHETTPLDYLVEKFEDKRWVVVGEYHRIRHDVELIASLVPRLHETTEVRHLAMEFLCRDRTAEANRLVTAATYDRGQMIDFFRSQFPGWYYEEYLEIFHNTWASNRRLAEERGPFRLVGLHPCIDWETIHYGADPAAAAEERRKQERYDEIMAEVLEEKILRPGHRALVFTGIAHATGKFAEYRSGTAEQLVRMGNLVYREPYRKHIFFVALHAPFYDHASGKDIYPFDGVLDELMPSYGEDIGFDVVGTPFENLVHGNRSERAITAYSFGELYDGYVMFKTPIKEYVGVTCIEDWVTDDEELRKFSRGLSNKDAADEFSKMKLEEFRADHCAPRPGVGVEFGHRFRALPDLQSRRPDERRDLLEELECADFRWVDEPDIADKAAMLVTLTVGDKPLEFQLDTGIPVTVIAESGAEKHGIEYRFDETDGSAFTAPVDLELAGERYPQRQVFIKPNISPEPAGSVGLDLLMGKIVVFDFPGGRFCVREANDPGVAALMESSAFTPVDVRDGKLFIDIEIGDERLEDVFFDTGASAFPLHVDLPVWQRLTGRNGAEVSNTRWQVRSWGTTVNFVGAPALGEMAVGGARIARPTVFYLEEKPESFKDWPFPVQGLIGNVPFLDQVVVLDMRPESSRFGLIADR